MNRNRFVIGTILGAAAGLVAGMLTAPKSGQETREEIKTKAREFREETARRAEEAKEAKKRRESIKQQAGGIARRGKKYLIDGDSKS